MSTNIPTIALGVNLFGDEHRHRLSRESYKKLSEKFNIKLFNLQFQGETATINDPDFENLHKLTISSMDIVDGSTKKLPTTVNCFDVLSDLDFDYFIFTNDDIIISPTYIEEIISSNGKDCYPASRQSIRKLDSLNDEIPIQDHYQVSGFDVFGIKPSWWKKNRDNFPNYVLGKPGWDVHYALLCMRHGDGVLCNKWPPPCFHISHQTISNDQCPEWAFNIDLFFNKYAEDCRIWHLYLQNVLHKRPFNYTAVFDNEETLEQIYFKQ